MKKHAQILGGIALVVMIAVVSRQTLIRKVAAAPKPLAGAPAPQKNLPDGVTDPNSLATAAMKGGIDYYPNAGTVVKGGMKSYPYATYKAGTPMFQVDPAWPKFPEVNWLLGEVPGVAVDAQDNVWITTRPKTLAGRELFAALRPPQADCCIPAPPVMEFDAAGNFIQGWGGPGPGFEWPQTEHGIHVDYKENVWITGNGPKDNQILKFTKEGKFLLQIGHSGKSQGSNDTENVNKATGVYVDPKTNEAYVSDGYINKRVIVFDADTGAYKRHWGAYGKKPDDSVGPSYTEPRASDVEGPGAKQFNTVHCVRISNDGLVYVCDRTNSRIQIFKPDGTFLKEFFVARKSTGAGVTDGVAFSPDPDQKFLYVADSPDQHVWIYDRKTLKVLGEFGHMGHYAGQTYHLHGIASDSKGNIYIAEGILGHRLQKFVYKGLASSASEQTMGF
jgi:DNA-binding beta-propeller fold protein YncE